MEYGCINEDEFSLHAPRSIEGDECLSLAGAVAQAMTMLEDGVDHVSVCKCKYYGEDGNGYWGEIQGEGQIEINATYCEWVKKEEEA